MNGNTDQPPTNMKLVKPWGFSWRSHPMFIIFTVGIGIFSDMFLYGLVVPILPSILEQHVGIPKDKHQLFVSELLSSFAIASVIFSPFAGALTDKAKTRQLPFLFGLLSLLLATVLLFTARTMPLLTLARVLQGASTALVWTVGLALCRDTVGSKNLGTAIGSIFSFVSVAGVLAPVAGGVLHSKFGIGSVAALALSLLCIDFFMRVLVIEHIRAVCYLDIPPVSSTQSDNIICTSQDIETTPLLTETDTIRDDDQYLIPDGQPYILRKIPLFYCLKSPSLMVALFMMLFQGILLGSVDATVPLHARALFEFGSLQSGLLFVPISICNLIVGPLAGRAVDRCGTRLVATIGYALFVPVLAALGFPESNPRVENIAMYSVILGLVGICLGLIDSPAIVEAGHCVERYHERNPEFFGSNGPYAQLYGISNMMMCLGLGLGPIVAGWLRVRIGYGNMNAVLAGGATITTLLCLMWLSRMSK